MQIELEALTELVQRASHPTEGTFAEWLWRYCSGNHLDPINAAWLYRHLGYVPFSGYPLKRMSEQRFPAVR